METHNECRGMKKCHFLTNISLYIGNCTKYGHSYYTIRIGNRSELLSLSTTIFNDLE